LKRRGNKSIKSSESFMTRRVSVGKRRRLAHVLMGRARVGGAGKRDHKGKQKEKERTNEGEERNTARKGACITPDEHFRGGDRRLAWRSVRLVLGAIRAKITGRIRFKPVEWKNRGCRDELGELETASPQKGKRRRTGGGMNSPDKDSSMPLTKGEGGEKKKESKEGPSTSCRFPVR